MNFGNFWNLKWQFQLNDHKYCQFFFVIFVKNEVLHILVEFESDRMSPRKSAKTGQNGAHRFICINFSILSSYSKSSMKITEKKFMSLRLFWNFRHPIWSVPIHDITVYLSKNLKDSQIFSTFFILRTKRLRVQDFRKLANGTPARVQSVRLRKNPGAVIAHA